MSPLDTKNPNGFYPFIFCSSLAKLVYSFKILMSKLSMPTSQINDTDSELRLIAGFFASLVASYIAKIKGRKICMIISGVCYLIGAGLTTGAVPRQSGLGMLIVGRIMLGVGVGFANSVSLDTPQNTNLDFKYLPPHGW